MSKLLVRVTPRAGADQIDGIDAGGRLRVRVRAAPAGGEANRAVARILATELGVPSRDILLVSGFTARLKTFDLPLTDSDLQQRIAAALAPRDQTEP